MGLIRKTLAVGTVGIVKPSSKKQRVAKKTLKEARKNNKLIEKQIEQNVTQAQLPPAGWMASDRPGYLRWWDGTQWTDQYRPEN